MYYEGKGVAQNYTEAVRWYKLAAAQGLPKAQYNLAMMYGKGEGVVQDYLHAHMWMNLAGVSGVKDAQKERDLIAKKMSSLQIEKAQTMAKKCLANEYSRCE